MFGSDVLDIAVGLALIYFLLSLVASSIREGVEAWLKTRASTLVRALRTLLRDGNGTGLVKQVYTHPLVSGLYQGDYDPERTRNLPSYIPASTFAVALLDIVSRGPAPPNPSPEDVTLKPLSLDALQRGANAIAQLEVRQMVLSAIHMAQGDLGRAQAHLEAWFNGCMDRASGWYRRHTHWWILAIGAVVTVGGNVNTLTLVHFLSEQRVTREVLVAHASAAARDTAASSKPVSSIRRDLAELALPIGWEAGNGPVIAKGGAVGAQVNAYLRYGAASFVGWILTVFAISLGAPFWFDVLGKVTSIRSTLKPAQTREDSDRNAERAAGLNSATSAALTPLIAPAGAPPRGGDGAPGAPSAPLSAGAGSSETMDFEPHEWLTGDPQEGRL